MWAHFRIWKKLKHLFLGVSKSDLIKTRTDRKVLAQSFFSTTGFWARLKFFSKNLIWMFSNFRSKIKKYVLPDFLHIFSCDTLTIGLHNGTNVNYPPWTVAEKKKFLAVKPHIWKLDFEVFEHLCSYFCTRSLNFG